MCSTSLSMHGRNTRTAFNRALCSYTKSHLYHRTNGIMGCPVVFTTPWSCRIIVSLVLSTSDIGPDICIRKAPRILIQLSNGKRDLLPTTRNLYIGIMAPEWMAPDLTAVQSSSSLVLPLFTHDLEPQCAQTLGEKSRLRCG